MATATLAFNRIGMRERVGRKFHHYGYLAPTADDDYAATGLAVSASTFGLSRLDDLQIHGIWADGGATAHPATAAVAGEGAYWDKTAGTVQMFTCGADGDPMDEGNTATIANYTLRVTAVGI